MSWCFGIVKPLPASERMPQVVAEAINPHLVCTLCQGYFRDAHTLPECLHSFCKSCILSHFHLGSRSCPKCHIDLGVAPKCIFDRTLHEIVDKLFPTLKDTDAMLEDQFYSMHGFQKRVLPVSPLPEKQPAPPPVEYPDISFRLVPATTVDAGHELPGLQQPQVTFPGHAKVQEVAKVVADHLQTRRVELVCESTVLPCDMAIHTVKQTVWKSKAKMVWQYREPHKDMV